MEMPELTPDVLLKAYAMGVFPMAEDRNDPELFWVDPRMRGVIRLDRFHVPRRLRRTVRKGIYEVTFDRAFEEVISIRSSTTRAMATASNAGRTAYSSAAFTGFHWARFTSAKACSAAPTTPARSPWSISSRPCWPAAIK
jgi:leucyl/phenylalanyl-tRNA--protein transferase